MFVRPEGAAKSLVIIIQTYVFITYETRGKCVSAWGGGVKLKRAQLLDTHVLLIAAKCTNAHPSVALERALLVRSFITRDLQASRDFFWLQIRYKPNAYGEYRAVFFSSSAATYVV